MTLGERPELGSYLISFKFDYMVLGVLLAYVLERAFSCLGDWEQTPSIVLILAPIGVLALCRSPLTAIHWPRLSRRDRNAVRRTLLSGAGRVAVGGNISRALPGALRRLLFWVGEEAIRSICYTSHPWS